MKKWIKCQVTEGLHPNMRFVTFATADGGVEEVGVSERLVAEEGLEAYEIGRRGDQVLLELPVESSAGNWRVWVTEDAIR